MHPHPITLSPATANCFVNTIILPHPYFAFEGLGLFTSLCCLENTSLRRQQIPCIHFDIALSLTHSYHTLPLMFHSGQAATPNLAERDTGYELSSQCQAPHPPWWSQGQNCFRAGMTMVYCRCVLGYLYRVVF